MNSFEEFATLWSKHSVGNKKRSLSNFIFVLVYPDNLKWDFGIEKQTQTTCLHITGGLTGGNNSHKLVFCRLSQVDNILKSRNETHAMIVTVGMCFDMTNPYHTPITSFFEFCKTEEYCRAHIIAKPNAAAYLHMQHVEINLTKWREIDCPPIFEKWKEYERAEDNFHDDYTPSWIIPKDRPKIINFSHYDRKHKAWSYPFDRAELQNETWNKIKSQGEIELDDQYFKILYTRVESVFFVENTESFDPLSKLIPKSNFNLIMNPASGYYGECLVDKLNFDGEIIFYDYNEKNVEIKKNIVDMNMTMEEIIMYNKNLNPSGRFRPSWPEKTQRMNFNTDERLILRSKSFGEFEQLRKLQEKMLQEHKVSYWHLDILKLDEEFVQRIKGKRLFINVSNIFPYHMSHLYYTLKELYSSYDNLIDMLNEHTEYYEIVGKTPVKENMEKVISNVR